jgi:3-oxoacyl-[acyl-carrier protein] reductase
VSGAPDRGAGTGDGYLAFVNGPGAGLARRLGLPRPVPLRRHTPGEPVLPGPAELVTVGTSALGDRVDRALRAVGAQVVPGPAGSGTPESPRPAAVVLDVTGTTRVAGLADVPDLVAATVRRLRGTGRVVVVGVPASAPGNAEAAAVRQGWEGFTRSLAKELRAGSTANLLHVDGPAVAREALESALGFLLSGRSAYVDGQVLALADGAVPVPADPRRPLDGKVAVVTGAARGIGAATARVLARDGATVVCTDLPVAGEALARVANDVGGTALQLDVAAPDAPRRLADHLVRRHGGVDVVVHNAGITRDRLFVNMRADRWRSVLDVNLAAQLRVDEVLLGERVLRDGGRVVCLSSTSGLAGNRGQTNYALSKAGVAGMVRAAAPSFAERGATVNAVAPGFVETEMTARVPRVTRELGRRLNSLQQGGLPVDVAEAVAWLASPAAGAVNGQVLRVCGQAIMGA